MTTADKQDVRQNEIREFSDRRIRLLDPFQIWFRPQVLLHELSQAPAGSDHTRANPWVPAVEIESRDDSLVVTAELPGLSLEDLKVEVIGNVLIVQGERRHEATAGTRGTERKYGHFYREIVLPAGADTEHVRAEFENGMLRVTVPVLTNRRAIPVQNTSQQSASPAIRNKEETA